MNDRGFDFAFMPNALAVGAVEFPNKLTDAGVFGIAYGYRFSEELQRQVPSLTLLVTDGDRVREAFEEFNAWAEVTGGDSVGITVVLRTSGGYLLAVYPEPHRLLQRCLGYDRSHKVRLFHSAWIKWFRSESGMIETFCEYANGLICPYLLDAALYVGIPEGDLDPNMIQPVAGLRPIMKYGETVAVHERDAGQFPSAQVALRVVDEKDEDNGDGIGLGERDDGPVESIFIDREANLAKHFPLTLARSATLPSLTDLAERIQSQHEVPSWQIRQALCNLVLSQNSLGQYHFASLPQARFDEKVTELVSQHYEIANSDYSILDNVTPELLCMQIAFDAKYLLNRLGHRVKKLELTHLVKRLKGLGLV